MNNFKMSRGLAIVFVFIYVFSLILFTVDIEVACCYSSYLLLKSSLQFNLSSIFVFVNFSK